ncbi:CYFA0S04e00716g1_1 [Cyberlindnera fabianii]|uniref:Protein DML1 n=1 Tax=Cyberlindnera fabianii TaxID=36022 RepID=A0A061AQU3_CYBFA|nr:Protein DML1 [Cyberlindnera fabianii]CDR39938.1 CYFA0S04e00716g1_1 [Cyberlindnera fabianii]
MHETINFSLSQRANHLSTHFYNAQESYLSYTKPASETPNDPNVFFKPTRSNGTVSYTPRALLWDMNGGFGSLGQFEYFPQSTDGDDAVGNVIKRERVPKSKYQTALDEGQPLPKLNKEDTRYWSDYSRVIFEPKSYNVLQKWEFDPVKYPKGRLAMGQEREFVGYDLGVEEWKNDYTGVEFLEDKYRVALEECDLVNGLNVVSEIDSAWGGFSSELLSELRDDYNPKTSIFTWGLYDGRNMQSLSIKEKISRIRTFLELQKNSSLFFPLGIPKNTPVGFDPTCLWQVTGLQNMIFESVQVLGSQRENNINFHTIESNFKLGSNRHLVGSIEATVGSTTYNFNNTFFPTAKEPHTFSTSTIHRPSQLSGEPLEVQASTSKDRTTTNYITTQAFPIADSYPPDLISSQDNLTVTLKSTSAPRKSLQEMKTYVSKFIKGDERADMINDLETLAAEYEHGWTDSDDDSDDDY